MNADQTDLRVSNTAAGLVALPSESIIEAISGLVSPDAEPDPMAQENFDADVIFVGSGPGGYVGAIRAAQLGASVIVVEREYLGGTCLNWGCIPSKAMIAATERLHHVETAKTFGIEISGDIAVNFEALMARKQKVVQTLRGGVGMLFKKNKIRHVEGFARFADPHTIEVEKDGATTTLRARKFVLAMGSSAIRLPISGLEGGRDEGVWTSDDAVTAPFIPKRMLVLGGGAVGCEFSYVFNGLGSDITLVEVQPTLLPLMDSELGTELAKILGKSGVKVKTSTGLERVERKGDTWLCHLKQGDKTETVEVDVVLLGVGRKANVDGMNLDKVGVKLHPKGVQVLDDTLVTEVPHIYALGDVTGRIQLAHVAMYEGVHVAATITGGKPRKVDYKAVPNAVYTSPEVASVGLTEAEAKAQGYDVVIGKAKFAIFGRAIATGETDGFVKVVAERKYGEVLGVHMLGAHVTDMIHEAVVAIKHEATLESMADCIHAHPTMSEAVLEAFEDALGHAIHKT
jgi:dihydrolipoamide dehydrogenase